MVGDIGIYLIPSFDLPVSSEITTPSTAQNGGKPMNSENSDEEEDDEGEVEDKEEKEGICPEHLECKSQTTS